MSETETFTEQLSRVEQMAQGDATWDLSDNDTAALEAVLASHRALLAALRLYVDHLGDPLKVARAAIARAEGRS